MVTPLMPHTFSDFLIGYFSPSINPAYSCHSQLLQEGGTPQIPTIKLRKIKKGLKTIVPSPAQAMDWFSKIDCKTWNIYHPWTVWESVIKPVSPVKLDSLTLGREARGTWHNCICCVLFVSRTFLSYPSHQSPCLPLNSPPLSPAKAMALTVLFISSTIILETPAQRSLYWSVRHDTWVWLSFLNV